MSKKVKAIFNTTKKNHHGFTIIEVLTAIAILAILSVAVFFAMNSSSKTYSKLSVEAQLQSEAQLVANMITELAIDSANAYSKIEAGTVNPFNPSEVTFNRGYNETADKILVLDSVLDSKKKQYVIAQKSGEEKLYMAERTYDATTSAWGTMTEALLGEYITGFTVDTSRVEQENVLSFTLSYEKNGRTYEGNYQVLMRNRAYADREKLSEQPKTGTFLSVGLNPKKVYLNVKGDAVTEAYYDEDPNGATTTNPYTNPASVRFVATVDTNSATADKNTVDWIVEGHDTNVFEVTSSGLQGDVSWGNKTKLFKNSPTDAFFVRASKTVTLEDGTTPLTRARTATILLRRIKALSLYSIAGSTQWRDEYDKFGTPSPGVDGYAYIGTNGRCMPMTIGATILSSNIQYGGGLRWYVYKQNDSGGWDKIAGHGATDNSALVTIQDKETTTATSNVLNFGVSVKHGQVYKVVAESIFDPTWTAEYKFGIAPEEKPGDDNDEFSIGFYQNMNKIYENLDAYRDNFNEKPPIQGGSPPISKLVFLKVTNITAGGNSDYSLDKIKVIRDEDGIWRMYIDFNAFAYDDIGQKIQLYTKGLTIHLVIGYYDPDGILRITGEDRDKYIAELEAQEGKSAMVVPSKIVFNTGAVKVSKLAPQKDVVVIAKGKSSTLRVQTQYYNILSPRNGMYSLGVYLNGSNDNLLEPGKSSINAYFNINMTSGYGDVIGDGKYVDKASIQVEAKTRKGYLTEPMPLQIAANQMYFATVTPVDESYTTYRILIANVEGTEVYIAGPEATGDYAWAADKKTGIDNGTKTDVKGLDSAGSEVDAKVYKSGKYYYCDYAGRTYIYNSTDNFWENE